MLGWLLGKKKSVAQRAEDSVWLSDAARLRGITREVDIVTEAERSAVVVALTLKRLDELMAALAGHQPLRCADVFEREALRRHVGRAGAVAVALPAGLPIESCAGDTIRARPTR